MADFGGLASVIQMQNQGITTQNKVAKTRKRSLDITDDPNTKVNSKLLQLLKDNQEEFLEETQQTDLDNLNVHNKIYDENENYVSNNFLFKIKYRFFFNFDYSNIKILLFNHIFIRFDNK